MATKADIFSFSGQQPRLSAGIRERIVSLLVLLVVVSAIALGWLHRNDGWIDPEYGLGYGLGIAGASMMLLLLAYPLRKRTKVRSKAGGSVGFWFRFHMLLGLMGPLAILYHSRFTWGSLNSAFAMWAMIIVASSGLIGRFLYSRVHRGFSDRKIELRALKQEMDELLGELEAQGIARGELLTRLHDFEDRAIAAGGAFWTSARSVVGLGIHTRRTERQLMRNLDASGTAAASALRAKVGHFHEAVRRAAEFAFYDRLLRLWHLLHLPLFILLVAAAILHVVAVHMY